MPNGGSDCCGTCWFNRVNDGKSGFPKPPRRDDAYCEIRSVAIAHPFFTYCANHPHHNPDRIDVPIGPIYVSDGYPYSRRVLEHCPDEEEVRAKLIELPEAMPETPRPGYPSATGLDEQVIDQLMAFREPRAVPGLRRVIAFDPMAATSDEPFKRSRITTAGHAIEALAAIAGDESLDEIERCPDRNSAEAINASGYVPKEDRMAPIRYHAVRGLAYCHAVRANSLLDRAMNDPHSEVVAFAKEIAAKRGAGSI